MLSCRGPVANLDHGAAGGGMEGTRAGASLLAKARTAPDGGPLEEVLSARLKPLAA